MGLSVSGLVSGIDVPTIVSQLMQSESLPQTALQSQLTSVQLQGSAYRAINTKFQALQTAAQAMATSSTWATTTASSSDPSVAVNSTSTAQAGSLTFKVTSLAQAQSVITSGTAYTSATAAYANSSISFTDSSGKATLIAVGGNGTLTDAANAINAQKLGVTAAVVQVGTNAYQLQVSSNTTGTSSGFTIDGGSGWQTLNAAQNATLQIGTSSTPYTVTSPTNTLTGLLPGVTLTVTQQTANPVTVSVAADPQAVGDQMKALVDAANAALKEIATDTATTTSTSSTATSGTAGPLSGDYTMQNLAQQVLNIVSSAVGALGSPAQIGLQLANPLTASTGSGGSINFDEDTFVTALKSNPSMAQSMVQGIPADSTTTPPTAAVPGIAAQLATLASNATNSVTGTLTTLAKGEDTQATSLKSQIDGWTTRLTLIQQQLTTTYTNMETMLSSLQSQQSWLSSMFNSLGGSSSSSASSSASVS